jgi:hypothetical protein
MSNRLQREAMELNTIMCKNTAITLYTPNN